MWEKSTNFAVKDREGHNNGSILGVLIHNEPSKRSLITGQHENKET